MKKIKNIPEIGTLKRLWEIKAVKILVIILGLYHFPLVVLAALAFSAGRKYEQKWPRKKPRPNVPVINSFEAKEKEEAGLFPPS